MGAFKPINNTNLYVEVINSILNAIATGYLKAGEKIIEQTIANEMNISRAPIREAIRELAAQGILDYTPKKGATVAVLTKKSIEETYSLRAILESTAVVLAIDYFTNSDIKRLKELSKEMTTSLKKQDVETFIKYDMEFHSFICEKSNHIKLKKLIDNFVLQTQLYMRMSKYNMLVDSNLSLEYGVHEELIELIEKKDKKNSESEMKKHILTSGDVLIKYLIKNLVI
ncbi:GntR family transcriptional regulator [Cetobacterium sp.]|uniref:GntR family transcriptional regulator n=1 Tax=Cetobacterium sp. TaxID=2071632 RepID=UPI003F2FBF68